MKAIDKPNTIASAVAVSYPLDGLKILDAIYQTGGQAVEVSDDEILSAEKELASQESIFVEPSGALPLAALHQLVKNKKIKSSDTVVCVLTGHGLKDPVTILKVLSSPPSIEPKISEVDKYLKMKLYNIKGTDSKDKNNLVWNKKPTKEQVNMAIKSNLDLSLTNQYVNIVYQEIESFFTKGKKMYKSDLQHIVEDILKVDPDAKQYINIEDFQVSAFKAKAAQAQVQVTINGNKKVSNQAQGVGPVDAVMKAVEKVIKTEKLKPYYLTDFDVKIDQSGTDATVETSMSLRDEKGNKVIATATSPDVIVASIKAFERGYNILCNK